MRKKPQIRWNESLSELSSRQVVLILNLLFDLSFILFLIFRNPYKKFSMLLVWRRFHRQSTTNWKLGGKPTGSVHMIWCYPAKAQVSWHAISIQDHYCNIVLLIMRLKPLLWCNAFVPAVKTFTCDSPILLSFFISDRYQ